MIWRINQFSVCDPSLRSHLNTPRNALTRLYCSLTTINNSAAGNKEGMKALAIQARETGRSNVAFLDYFVTGQVWEMHMRRAGRAACDLRVNRVCPHTCGHLLRK